VKEILKSASPIVYIPYEQAYGDGFEDMHKRVPDTGKIQDLIGYDPQFGLKDIIVDVAKYQRNGSHNGRAS
jgi:UDP-glucose 4-epimerase